VSVAVALGMGLVLGLRHATDADHVAAVATLLQREHTTVAAARIGALWGLGHGLVLIVAAALMQFAGVVVAPRFAFAAELCVCVMLVLLGVVGLRRARRTHAEKIDTHKIKSSQENRAIGVGAMHGLAGSSAVVLLAAASNEALSPVAFISLFSVGTVLGMALTTTLLSFALTRAARRSERMQTSLLTAASASSIVLGVVLGALLVRGAVTS
jgi:high-affinity nickel-transport protein